MKKTIVLEDAHREACAAGRGSHGGMEKKRDVWCFSVGEVPGSDWRRPTRRKGKKNKSRQVVGSGGKGTCVGRRRMLGRKKKKKNPPETNQ